VVIGRDDSTRRCRVGAGWAGEPAVYLLRPPLTGVSRAQWLALSIIEPPSADQIANRACWRVTIRDDDAETRLWFDAEIPLVLRIATRAIATDNAGISAEIVELHLSAPEPHLWNHPLLGEPSQVALDPVPPAAEDLLDSIKTVMADAHTVQLFAWEPAGSFVARIVMPTTHGPAELLIDRRSITAPPYEGTHAAMIRGGDARWTYSFDHDPEIGHALVRELAKTLPRLIS
jgi:hypothetical protein